MTDAQKTAQMQRRVLVLARCNADPYNQDRWWENDEALGLRSLLFRYRVVAEGETTPAGVIPLPKSADLRADAFYATACPSFREQFRRCALSNGTQVAFTCADTPAHEDRATESRRTVCLYPDSPLLSETGTGFDLIGQLGWDADTVIRFEAGDGYSTLLALFGRYMSQFGSPGGMTRLPEALTDTEKMPAVLAATTLDAVFAPASVYRFDKAREAELAALARRLNLQAAYQVLNGTVVFLAGAILDFRRVVVTPGASSLRPLDPRLVALTTGVAKTDDIVPNLAGSLKALQDARMAMNRAAQTLQSGLSHGSIADWLLAKNVSELEDLVGFRTITADTFEQGVAEGRAGVVGGVVRAEVRKRFDARLLSDYPGDAHALTRSRLGRMYDLAEPYLCATPVFRVRDVEARGREEATLLLDEALAEQDPKVLAHIEQGGRRAGAVLRRVLLAHARVEYQLPGLNLNGTVAAGPLTAVFTGDRVTIQGVCTRENVEKLLADTLQDHGAVAANALFRTFQSGENSLPEDQYSHLDAVLDPLVTDLHQADRALTELHQDLRVGFAVGIAAVGVAGIALGLADGRATAGDIWDRTSREETRPALSSTGLRRTQLPESAYARILAALPPVPAALPSLTDAREAELLRLCDRVLAAVQPTATALEPIAAIDKDVATLRESLGELDARDVRVTQGSRTLDELERLLAAAQSRTAATSAAAQVNSSAAENADDAKTQAAEAQDTRLAEEEEFEAARRAVEDARLWLLVLHEEKTVPVPLPIATDLGALTHYYDGRQRILDEYLKLAGDPTRTFTARTRFVWLTQLVTHIHRRLPLTGRTDAGNLCGLILELVRHWHDGRSADQLRADFFAANPGGLANYLPAQTVDDVRALARGYHDHAAESRRTLHDLRTDLAGMEALLRSLPAGAEVLLLNMTADDFAALDWNDYPELFDAFQLQAGPSPSLIPTALFVSRSAQRWPADPAVAMARLSAFLTALDGKVHGEAHAGRCVVPPVLVATREPAPLEAGALRERVRRQVRVSRGQEVASVDAVATVLDGLQPGLAFPTAAVGATAQLTNAAVQIDWSPYLLLARLCGAPMADPLKTEGTVSLPTSPSSLAFVQPGQATVAQLIDTWLGEAADARNIVRTLGPALFGWWASVMFRAEMGAAGGPPVSPRNRDGHAPAGYAGPPATVNNFWVIFTTPPAMLETNDVVRNQLDVYHTHYVRRLQNRADRRFDGWAFVPRAGVAAGWNAITTGRPAVLRLTNPTPLDFLPRLLGKLF